MMRNTATATAAIIKSAAQITAQFAPVPWMTPAVNLLCGIVDLCARFSSNKFELRQLQVRCIGLLEVVLDYSRSSNLSSDRIDLALDSVVGTLDFVQRHIQVWAKKHRLELFTLQFDVAADIQQCHVEITNCLNKFQFTSHLQIHEWQAEFDANRESDHLEVVQYLSDIENTQKIMLETQKEDGNILRNILLIMQKGLSENSSSDNDRGLETNLYHLQKSARTLLPKSNLKRGEVHRNGEWPVDGSHPIYDIWEGIYLGKEKVAIKVIRAAQSSPKTLQRFKREAKIWGLVWEVDQGDHIVPFYGFCQNDGPYPYVVSPWQHNGTAINYVTKHPDVDHMELIRGIAEGLEVLHTMNPPVVHGNLKGTSVMISNMGNPLLADFGFSKVVEDISGAPFTASTGISDAYRWFAPELIMEQGVITTACDIYSFGMTILELLTHKHPWAEVKRPPTIIIKVSKEELPARPQDPTAASRGLDDTQWSLLQHCWSRSANERPTIRQVLKELN